MKKALPFAVTLFYFLVSHHAYSQVEPTRDLFLNAYRLFIQESRANPPSSLNQPNESETLNQAEELFFRTLDDTNFVLRDYSLYFLSRIQFSRQAYSSARNSLIMLGEKFPQSVWFLPARLQLAKISFAEKNYPAALRDLRDIQNKTTKRDIVDEALYLQAQIEEELGNSKTAHAHYQTLRNASPLSAWAIKARKDVRRLREAHPKLFDMSSFDNRLDEARILSREQQHDDAEKLYRQLLGATRDGNLRPTILMELANIQQSRRRRREEIPVLAEIVEQYPKSPEASQALYRLARNYWNLDENLKALGHFDRLRERYPGSSHADMAFFASARIYESLGQPQRALQFYHEFSKKFPSSRLKYTAQWRLAWIYYLRGDYDRAQTAFGQLASDRGADSFRPGARYWQARASEKIARQEEAKRLYLEILSETEETYYKGPATKALQRLGVTAEQKRSTKEPPAPRTPAEVQPDTLFHLLYHLVRAHELASLSLHELAVTELDAMSRYAETPLLRGILMTEYERNHAYDRSVLLANQTEPLSQEVKRYRFPLGYWERIQEKAAERQLDPYLVIALIRQESLFNPKAVSPASAFGLMQLIPSTAGRMAQQAGLKPPPTEKLFEPELNLILGTNYLKQLMRLYDNNLIKVLAAYNAGEKAVDRWERTIRAEDDEEFIERIPYEETRLYVKLVLRNYRIYQNLYLQQQ